MNRIEAVVTRIEESDSLSLVYLRSPVSDLVAFVLDRARSAPYVREGERVTVLFKATELAVSKGLEGVLSLSNRFDCTLSSVDTGALLAQLTLQCGSLTLRSVITARSARRMNLAAGDRLEAWIKSNELSLMEAKSE